LNVAESILGLHQYLQQHAAAKVALVPTMGNLHQGHLDLIERAHELADIVVVSIFVNPLQFEAGGDLENYPRTLQVDIEKLQQAGVHMLFSPEVHEIYGDDLSATTQVVVPGISSLWCGASREGHFEGVTTVVNKLLNIVQPDIAIFGEKDFQQLTIIRMMVNDLNIPVDIVGVATRREADGLAMSSRNGYLTSNEREVAPKLREILLKIQDQVVSGSAANFQIIIQNAVESLNASGFNTDYLSICRQSDLKPATAEDSDLVILAAAYLGKARLIDNLVLVNR
jgi:pantoate--beta-alanine ligase